MRKLETIVVTSMAAVLLSCTSGGDSLPEGLSLSTNTEIEVVGSFSEGDVWIRFVSTVDDSGTTEVVVTGAGGELLRTIDRKFVTFGDVEIMDADLDDAAAYAAAELAVTSFLRSPEGDLTSRIFRGIDTPEEGLGLALSALYVMSSAIEAGVLGEYEAIPPPDEADQCWNKCCGTDCDCYHYNPCSWWDPTCNYCANHDACIHNCRDHNGLPNWFCTGICT